LKDLRTVDEPCLRLTGFVGSLPDNFRKYLRRTN